MIKKEEINRLTLEIEAILGKGSRLYSHTMGSSISAETLASHLTLVGYEKFKQIPEKDKQIAELQAKLEKSVELPLPIGTEFYFLFDEGYGDGTTICQDTWDYLEITQEEIKTDRVIYKNKKFYDQYGDEIEIFLTKPEAQQRLKELGGNK